MEPIARGDGLGVPFFVGSAGEDLSLSIHIAAEFSRYAFRSTATSPTETGAGFIRIRRDTRVGCRRAYSRASTAPQECPSNAGASSRKCCRTLSRSATSDASVTSPGCNVIRGFPASSLIVVNQAECICQSVQIGQKIAVVEIGSAVEDDDRLPLPISRVSSDVPPTGIRLSRGAAACSALAEGSHASSAAARLATMQPVFMGTPYRSCAVGASAIPATDVEHPT